MVTANEPCFVSATNETNINELGQEQELTTCKYKRERNTRHGDTRHLLPPPEVRRGGRSGGLKGQRSRMEGLQGCARSGTHGLGLPWRIQGFRRPWRDHLGGRGPSPYHGLYGYSHSTPLGCSQETQALGGAQEAQALRGALETWALGGALEAWTLEEDLEGAAKDRALEGAAEEKQMAAGLREPRTAVGYFWIGAGYSPDTGGSFPSVLVLWCLGGPRDDGKNSERMVASSSAVAVASLQNSQEYSTKGRCRRARAMKRAAVSIAVGKKTQNEENKRGQGALLTFLCVGGGESVTICWGARSEEIGEHSNFF